MSTLPSTDNYHRRPVTSEPPLAPRVALTLLIHPSIHPADPLQINDRRFRQWQVKDMTALLLLLLL